jgi:hypothetical protein
MVDVPVGADLSQPLEIVLRDGGEVQGLVTFAEPPEGVKPLVLVSYSNDDMVTTDGVELASDGSYAISRVRPGDVRVILHLRDSEGIRNVIRPAVVENGKVTTVDFDVSEGRSGLEGVVSLADPKRSLTNGVVILWLQTAQGEEAVLRPVAADGSFRFEGLPAGSCSAEILGNYDDGSEAKATAVVNVNDGEITTWELRL